MNLVLYYVYLFMKAGPPVNLENGASRIRESVGERRRSSVTQDLTEYTYSVAEEPDAEVADDDDVFEVEAGAGGGEQVAPGNGGGSANEAKRRTQSLGSLSGEPKSPRKVLNAAYVNKFKLLLSPSLSLSLAPPLPFLLLIQIINQYRSGNTHTLCQHYS